MFTLIDDLCNLLYANVLIYSFCLVVCELYADSSIVVDKTEAKYWHDKAETQFPYHPVVIKLKKKMFAIGESQNGMSVESILLGDICSHLPALIVLFVMNIICSKLTLLFLNIFR